MPIFLVQAPRNDPVSRADGVNAVLVFAADAADARAMCQARFSQDGNASWNAATATTPAAGANLQNWRLRARAAAPTGGKDVFDETFTGLAAATMDDLAAGLVVLLNATAPVAASTYGNRVTAAAIVAGGTGYTVSDTLTLVGGTGTAATLNVDSVSGGVIDGISVLTRGAYSATPGDPVSVTGGTGGDDATFNLTTTNNVLEVAALSDGLGDHTLVVDLLPPAVGHGDNVSIPGGVLSLVHEGIAAAVLDANLALDAFVVPLIANVLKQV